jgi:hypothetical protein
MAFKPNYRQERAQRERTKETRKQEKLKRLEEETAKRKAAREGIPGDEPEPKT